MPIERPFLRPQMGKRPDGEDARRTMRAPLNAINQRIDEIESTLTSEIDALRAEIAILKADAKRRKGGRPRKTPGPKVVAKRGRKTAAEATA